MPDPDAALLARARSRSPEDPEVRDCWALILQGIELGWLDTSEINELLDYLRRHADFGVEELLFANIGERLRVSLLDERVTCAPAALIAELAALIR